MAHFRAVIKGQRGEASRLGTKKSGIYGRIQTWSYDAKLNLRHDTTQGEDWLEIKVTPHVGGGSVQVLDINLTTGKAYARKDTVPA